ncbi:putative membrane-anchored protein [Pedobacter sp. CAN_A7]|uniref:DUF3667 domain-containing protein n=1 Tax=Pedobacter sp. CAN_A7 TaxID=2787722 RepID=UPI0018C9890A
MTDRPTTNCKNCKTEVNLNYCHNCGQPVLLKRINGHYIIHEVEHVLHFEKGILYTIRELLIRPGENVKQFISENRSRLVKPIIFIIITSLAYSLINHYFHLEDGYVNYSEQQPSTTGIFFKWVQAYYGYSNIIMGIFIAFYIKLFFRKYNYNFFEILILLCFTMGMGMLIYALFALFQGITHLDLMAVGGFVGVTYCSYAIAQFFDKKKPGSYVKALASYLLGMITFWLTLFLLGTIIDFIIK